MLGVRNSSCDDDPKNPKTLKKNKKSSYLQHSQTLKPFASFKFHLKWTTILSSSSSYIETKVSYLNKAKQARYGVSTN
jgi:hypothetical protein